MTTTKFTLTQAAKAVSKSKSALLTALRSGRLSGTRNEIGIWEIEPCELFRVYPPTRLEDDTQNDDLPHYLPPATPIDERIKQLEEERARERKQFEDTISDLRKRLDDEASERRKLTALLTHQKREQEEPPAPNDRLLKKLFRGKGY